MKIADGWNKDCTCGNHCILGKRRDLPAAFRFTDLIYGSYLWILFTVLFSHCLVESGLHVFLAFLISLAAVRFIELLLA